MRRVVHKPPEKAVAPNQVEAAVDVLDIEEKPGETATEAAQR